MAIKNRLHRSELAVPGSNSRMLEKAPALGADVVFMDLEDAVAPDDKEQARENLIHALNSYDWSGCSVSVGINGLDTHYCYRDVVDVVEQARDKLDTILIPKVGRPSDILFVATLLEQIEAVRGYDPINIRILIETAMGMANVERIAETCPERLEAMVFGVADYSASVQARSTQMGGANPDYGVLSDADEAGERVFHWGDQWHFAMSRMIVACRANGLRPIDGPYGNISDPDGFLNVAHGFAALGGEGKKPIQWAEVAQNVGLPGRENCGACHFYGGGGDGVKHGDLDSSLQQPARELDVHLSADGANFTCIACQVTRKHLWAGSRYNVIARDTVGTGKPGMRRDVATCESCHGIEPYPVAGVVALKLNNHVSRIACQTCHIPTIARGGVATKVDWDWRTAGKTKNGEGYKEKDYTQGNGEHRATYKSIKGSFTYKENFAPYYAWFDGQMDYTTIDTVFDPAAGPVAVNGFKGSAEDPASRIWPFKRMHTIQPYDKGNNTLVYMHLWGDDENAYGGNYDFGRAIEVGMEKNGIPYSGEFGFAETWSFWPITHMVAPKENVLECGDCHAGNGRLAGLEGVYLPGRDANRWLDLIGLLAVAGPLAGVLGHDLIRKLSFKGGDHA